MIATQESISASRSEVGQRLMGFAPAALIALGLIARLIGAYSRFLNADEAMHYLLANQNSFAEAYRASLGTAHPPLLILFLHYWEMISAGEFFLRLPSVLAETAAGWFLYAWLREIANRTTALIALALFLFSPALIYTSAEVRQYALLLCFAAATLYLLDAAFIRNSAAFMLASAVALYLALLTHYCAFIFAIAVGIYGILRILPARPSKAVVCCWLATQAGGVAIAGFLWESHISLIRHRPLTLDVANSYLRSSLFQPGHENVFLFLARANLRLFHFLFSEGAVSVLALLLFVVGIVLSFRKKNAARGIRLPSSRQIGILLLLPFVLNCAAALAGIYPYGGTRHDSYLALFAMPAVAVAVDSCRINRSWVKPLMIALALVICNFTVVPAGAYIKPKNQKKQLMNEAAGYLRASAPAGSIILTDYESGLLLSYYLCHSDITHAGVPAGSFYHSSCGNYESASLLPRLWVFRASTFPSQVSGLEQRSTGREIWLFQTGFIVDREPEFQAFLRNYGCTDPRRFGANILVCRINCRMVETGQDARLPKPECVSRFYFDWSTVMP